MIFWLGIVLPLVIGASGLVTIVALMGGEAAMFAYPPSLVILIPASKVFTYFLGAWIAKVALTGEGI